MEIHYVEYFFEDFKTYDVEPEEGFVRHYRDVNSGEWGKKWLWEIEDFGNFSNTDYPEKWTDALRRNVQERLDHVSRSSTISQNNPISFGFTVKAAEWMPARRYRNISSVVHSDHATKCIVDPAKVLVMEVHRVEKFIDDFGLYEIEPDEAVVR
ncbi:hypothetical protein OESDEN_13123 [Oesophagostomum dentatum]|uniref:Glycosyltransferase family 92 protein n=1 Tax=Oesophagostomum dentatum TaxID=61180 RepID=A0A0B1SQ97_OESDE|nr:hypothetical protein OESDEN_13123 [Oesophagostomum dentatum]